MQNYTYEYIRDHWGYRECSTLSKTNFEFAQNWAERSGVEINWLKPVGLNDLINWLKVFDIQWSKVPWSNKYAAKNIVSKLNLDGLRIPETLLFTETINDLIGKSFPFPTLIKGVADSGSVFRLAANQRLSNTIHRHKTEFFKPYGFEKGEWPYQFAGSGFIIEKQVSRGMLNDIKLHCYDGKVIFVQVIWDRANGAKEALLTRDGILMDFSLDHQFEQNANYPEIADLQKLVSIAEFLAAPFRYVRVDLYEFENLAVFGELTFFPKAGCYKGPGQGLTGKMMPLENLTPYLCKSELEEQFSPLFENNIYVN